MRYFEKQTSAPELLLEKWKEENDQKIQEWIKNENKTGDHLWSELGKTFSEERETGIDSVLLRNELETFLFEEQKGLCCYCGNRLNRELNTQKNIYEYKYRAIEHFRAKNKHKNLTFTLSNLMLCCKESQLSSISIGGKISGKEIKKFEDIEKLIGLSEATLRKYSKNKALGIELKKNDKVYIPNPPHCDDSKSVFDGKTEERLIINPSKDFELINRLTFSDNGTIDYSNKINEPDKVIENTLEVLALNCSTLKERRRDKWKNAKIDYDVTISEQFDKIAQLEDSEIKPFVNSIINQLKNIESTPDEKGLLEPFFFVNIAFLDSLFNGK